MHATDLDPNTLNPKPKPGTAADGGVIPACNRQQHVELSCLGHTTGGAQLTDKVVPKP